MCLAVILAIIPAEEKDRIIERNMLKMTILINDPKLDIEKYGSDLSKINCVYYIPFQHVLLNVPLALVRRFRNVRLVIRDTT